MDLSREFLKNTRKPEGELGKLMINRMNVNHEDISNWGFSKIPNLPFEKIIDLGCGGGINVKKFLNKFPLSKVTGVDYSPVSIEETKKLNIDDFNKKRLTVVEANVSNLPFNDNEYDFASAFETVYFWEGPVKSFKEVYRILKPNGIFMIVNDADSINERTKEWITMIDGLRIYEKNQLANFLKLAGFSKITIYNENEHLCILGKK